MIPCKKCFTQEALPAMYSLMFLGQILFLLLQTYGHAPVLTNIVFRWLDNEYNLKNVMLNAIHFPRKHSDFMIESVFNQMLTEWPMEDSRVHILIHDGASIITYGARSSGQKSIHFCIHRLQLSIKDLPELSWNSNSSGIALCI